MGVQLDPQIRFPSPPKCFQKEGRSARISADVVGGNDERRKLPSFQVFLRM